MSLDELLVIPDAYGDKSIHIYMLVDCYFLFGTKLYIRSEIAMSEKFTIGQEMQRFKFGGEE